MQIGPGLGIPAPHRHPVADRGELIRLAGDMEEPTPTLGQHLASGRLHRVEVAPELTDHTGGFQTGRRVGNKCPGPELGPSQSVEGHAVQANGDAELRFRVAGAVRAGQSG